MNNKNRGMILEKIINKTIELYQKADLAIFHKKNLDISFKNVNDSLKIENAFISRKSTVDYYGIFNGKFVAFEAKSTNENILPLQNIKQHQLDYLQKIHKHNGYAFFIILFKNHQKFFILNIKNIQFLQEKYLSIDFLKKYGFELELTYPGIIDFLPLLINWN